MKPLQLVHPVHTLDGTVLLEAGTEVTDDVVREVASRAQPESYPHELFLSHGCVREDMQRLLSALPNQRVLATPESIERLLFTMHAIVLSKPILDSLDYFRENDFYTYRHTLVVMALTSLIARDLLDDYPDRLVGSAAGPIHDIGKTCVPLPILTKSTPLTREERRILEHHAVAGYVLLSYYMGEGCVAARVARDHHERCNGSGYPRGIDVCDPIVEIISVCDVYDALVSDRPYRPAAYDNRTALEELTAMAQRGELRADVVKALIARNRDHNPSYRSITVSLDRRGRPPEGNVYGKFQK